MGIASPSGNPASQGTHSQSLLRPEFMTTEDLDPIRDERPGGGVETFAFRFAARNSDIWIVEMCRREHSVVA